MKTLLFSEEIFSSGFFNPYLSHFLYLSDLFLLMSVLLLSISFLLGHRLQISFKDRKVFMAILLFLFSYCISLFFSVNLENSLLYLLRALEFFVVYLMIVSSFINLRNLIYIFVTFMGLEALIGVSQYLLQESVGLSLIGEPLISSTTLGVAKINVLGSNVLRSYGTFSHPNLFAAYLVFSIYFVLEYLRFSVSKLRKFLWILLFLMLIALVLTFSRTAFLVFIVSVPIYFFRTKFFASWMTGIFTLLLFLGLLLFLDISKIFFERFVAGDLFGTFERVSYFDMSKNIFFDNLFGVGAGNFTSVMQAYHPTKLMPWVLQPVHTAYLLAFTELGILGGISFFAIIYLLLKSVKNGKIVPISFSLIFIVLFLSLSDHYFLSLYQGQVLFWFIIALLSVSDNRLKKIWSS